MLTALLYALIYFAIICGVAFLARWAVGKFLAPMAPDLATIANFLIGLVAFIACILVLIAVVNGGTGLALLR